jgi:hypothetical protein
MPDGREGEEGTVGESVNSVRVQLVKIKNQLFEVVRPGFEPSSPRAAF